MDIDQLKSQWKNMNTGDPKSTGLSESQLKDVIRRRYRGRILRMLVPKLLMTGLYTYLALFILVFFEFFPGLWLTSLAVLALVLLFIIPVMDISALYNYYRSGRLDRPVGDTIESIRAQGIRFLRAQRMLMIFNLILLAVLVLIVPRVYSEQLDTVSIFRTIALGTGLTVLISLLLWRYYRKQMNHILRFIKTLH